MAHRFQLLWFAFTLSIAGTALAGREPATPPDISAADVAQRIHQRINAERRKHKLPTLAWDARLAAIAAAHSQDMAHRQYLSHDSPEGHGFDQRYRQAGYRCEVHVGNIVYTGAENIALGRLYNAVTHRNGVSDYDWNSPEDISRKAVEGWMQSTGHRRNLLAPHWHRQGIGVQVGSGNTVYITENFC